MRKYQVHTAMTAYTLYFVEAESVEDAELLVTDALNGQGDLEMTDRIMQAAMPDGYGDDENIIDTTETV